MKLFLLVFGLMGFIKPTHDMPIAIYRIYESEDQVLLEITFDTQDICKELKITSPSELKLNIIQDYVKAHTSFEFDSEIKEIIFKDELKLNAGHIEIYGTFKNAPKTPKIITVNNTCLNSIDDHSNIIYAELNNAYRDFLMDKTYTEIHIKY